MKKLCAKVVFDKVACDKVTCEREGERERCERLCVDVRDKIVCDKVIFETAWMSPSPTPATQRAAATTASTGNGALGSPLTPWSPHKDVGNKTFVE